MLVYLLKGNLPWYNNNNYPKNCCGAAADATEEKKVNKSVRIKLQTSVAELTRDLPIEFAKYFTDLSELGQDEEPSYFTLRNRFRTLAKKHNQTLFDWDIIVPPKPNVPSPSKPTPSPNQNAADKDSKRKPSNFDDGQ